MAKNFEDRFTDEWNTHLSQHAVNNFDVLEDDDQRKLLKEIYESVERYPITTRMDARDWIMSEYYRRKDKILTHKYFYTVNCMYCGCCRDITDDVAMRLYKRCIRCTNYSIAPTIVTGLFKTDVLGEFIIKFLLDEEFIQTQLVLSLSTDDPRYDLLLPGWAW
jgi:hypothetical protein